jgi:hypothetical protein
MEKRDFRNITTRGRERAPKIKRTKEKLKGKKEIAFQPSLICNGVLSKGNKAIPSKKNK